MSAANNVVYGMFTVYNNDNPEPLDPEEIKEIREQIAYYKAKMQFLKVEKEITEYAIEQMNKILMTQKDIYESSPMAEMIKKLYDEIDEEEEE